MRKLSDFKGDEAIELWADLIDPLSIILTDTNIRDVVQSGQPKMAIAKEILKLHSQEAVDIMLRIDPTPIDGLNVILRLVALLADIGENEEIKSFFGYAEQAKTESESFGSPMVNTEAKEN
jgi:hypothetical protein